MTSMAEPARTFGGPMDHGFTLWLMNPGGEELPSLEDLLRRPRWHLWAACRGVGHKGFVASRGVKYDEHARQLCASCPVRQECLETALADPELIGMWGGTTPRQRKEMRRGVA